jgi:3-phenylpropionate/trans-cinnamate dioxygenase ferredoxin reductase subunit
LAKGGFAGSVALLSDESVLPYKRPPLSKGYLLGAEGVESLPLRTEDYWTQSAIDLIRDAAVSQVDSAGRTVETSNGKTIGYWSLVWAAGGRPHPLPVPGEQLVGVHTLRTLADATRLKDQMWSARRAVVVGAGYIGLEIASAMRGIGLEVTVVEAGTRVLERVTSDVVSEFFQRVHRDAGVDLRLGTTVTEFRGSGNRLNSAVLTGGVEIGCDIAVVGVGMEPNVEPLAATGVGIAGGVEVDALGRTGVERISAIGDCTSQLHPLAGGSRVRLESVQNAGHQAKVVASDILGEPKTGIEVPWSWSDQYLVKLKAAGIPIGFDETVVRGDPALDSFSVLYLAGGRLVALDCVNRATDFTHGRFLIKSGAQVAGKDFEDPAKPLHLALG